MHRFLSLYQPHVKFSILYIFILLITKRKVNKKFFPCPGRGPPARGGPPGRRGSRGGCYAAACTSLCTAYDAAYCYWRGVVCPCMSTWRHPQNRYITYRNAVREDRVACSRNSVKFGRVRYSSRQADKRTYIPTDTLPYPDGVNYLLTSLIDWCQSY